MFSRNLAVSKHRGLRQRGYERNEFDEGTFWGIVHDAVRLWGNETERLHRRAGTHILWVDDDRSIVSRVLSG
jgi:hypothetical protein